jgi:hypothetical protein
MGLSFISGFIVDFSPLPSSPEPRLSKWFTILMLIKGGAKDLTNKLLNVLEDKELANNILFNA